MAGKKKRKIEKYAVSENILKPIFYTVCNITNYLINHFSIFQPDIFDLY